MRIQMIMQDDPLNHRSFKMDIGGFETVGDLCREIDAPCAERQCVGGLASAYCPAELNEKATPSHARTAQLQTSCLAVSTWSSVSLSGPSSATGLGKAPSGGCLTSPPVSEVHTN